MKREGSSSCSQEPDTGLILSFRLRLGLASGVFPRSFSEKRFVRNRSFCSCVRKTSQPPSYSWSTNVSISNGTAVPGLFRNIPLKHDGSYMYHLLYLYYWLHKQTLGKLKVVQSTILPSVSCDFQCEQRLFP